MWTGVATIQEKLQWFTTGVQNVPLSSFFAFRFNQFIDLDETPIQLTRPEGNVELLLVKPGRGWTRS